MFARLLLGIGGGGAAALWVYHVGWPLMLRILRGVIPINLPENPLDLLPGEIGLLPVAFRLTLDLLRRGLFWLFVAVASIGWLALGGGYRRRNETGGDPES